MNRLLRSVLFRLAPIIAASILAASILPGCAASPRFVEPEPTAPHAAIVFEKAEGLFGGLEVVPLEINGLPPGSMTDPDLVGYRLPPGDVVVFAATAMPNRMVGSAFIEVAKG